MQNSEEPDFYLILGLDSSASSEDIKRSYRKLARKYHPDIAGNDPQTAAMFAQIKRAYEVLTDPQLKDAYDNRHNRGPSRNKRFHRSSWRMPGTARQEEPQPSTRFKKRRWADPANNISFDDLFGSEESTEDGRATEHNQGTYERGDTPGQDISQTVPVPRSVLTNGGTVMVEYERMVRTPQGNLVPYDEIYALRVPPGTRNGACLRGDRYGHDSPDGGRAGDLICDIVIDTSSDSSDTSGRTEPKRSTGGFSPSFDSPAESFGQGGDLILDITIPEAVLGGRVSVQAPAGRVIVGIPPRTSSGQRMRLKGKGHNGGDLYVVTQIVVPTELDSESESLIRQFAMLNPDSVVE